MLNTWKITMPWDQIANCRELRIVKGRFICVHRLAVSSCGLYRREEKARYESINVKVMLVKPVHKTLEKMGCTCIRVKDDRLTQSNYSVFCTRRRNNTPAL